MKYFKFKYLSVINRNHFLFCFPESIGDTSIYQNEIVVLDFKFARISLNDYQGVVYQLPLMGQKEISVTLLVETTIRFPVGSISTIFIKAKKVGVGDAVSIAVPELSFSPCQHLVYCRFAGVKSKTTNYL